MYASSFRSNCFYQVEKEEIPYLLDKDKVLLELSQDTYHKWKRKVLDHMYAKPLEKNYDKIPKWMFYSPQMLSMTYSHMFRRVQEENLSILWKIHKRYLPGDVHHVQYKIGVFWYNSRLWFIAENMETGVVLLLW